MSVEALKTPRSIVDVHTDSSGTIVGETFAHLDDTNNVDHLSKQKDGVSTTNHADCLGLHNSHS